MNLNPMTTPMLHEAEHYELLDEGTQIVQCHLCPHECVLLLGEKGQCQARINMAGKLYSLTYGFTEMKIDLIEKQHIYHFHPNSRVQTFSTFNCNIDCNHCPSSNFGKADPENISAKRFAPDQAVMFGAASGSKVICFGESEPFVSYEWVRDTAKLAKERGLKTLIRTNAYFNEAPTIAMLEFIDAVAVSIKATSDEGYQNLCNGGTFEHVKKIVKLIYQQGKLLELSISIHEELNNTDETARELAEWIAEELGSDVPLHISRLKPIHRVNHLLPTSQELLERAYVAAKDKGLNFVYIDDIIDHAANNTYCPECNELLIQRSSTETEVRRVSLQGKCNKCQAQLNIVLN